MDILGDMENLQFVLLYNSTTLHKFEGGQYEGGTVAKWLERLLLALNVPGSDTD